MQALGSLLNERKGYQKFIAKRAELGLKKGEIKLINYNKITSVNSQNLYIEKVVIEKKEVKTTNNEVKVLRIVNNLDYLKEGQLVLPDEITSLVDNPIYLNRHKKLARDYGVKYLLKLAELARSKKVNKPSNWYAKATSCKNWQEQTEHMLIELFKKIDKMKEKLKGLVVGDKWINYYIMASSKLSEAKFNRCIELARSRGVIKPPNLFAKAINNSLQAV